MKIRELKAELASHGICTGNILEKSELVRAVHEARKAAAAERQKERGDHDDIASMSVKQLKMELEKCGISPSHFFEKGDMQEALRSARSINAAPPSVFPASLSESFGTKPQPSARTTTSSRSSASTPSNSRPKKPIPPQRSKKVSDQYTWSSSKVSSSDAKSSTSSSRRSARRHSSEKRSQPDASCCDTSAGTSSQDGDMKRMPRSFFPVNTFDSGTAGGEPMGGNPGAGLGSSVGGDAVFSDSPTDGNTDATNKTIPQTTFIPASFKKAPVHRKSQRMPSRDGKRNDVKRHEYDARAPAQQSPSSVANNSLEQDARPEWLQM